MESPPNPSASHPPPLVPEHELLARIGAGSFGEVWLARNRLGTLRAVKVVYRDRFASDRAYERELNGLRQFEPVSRTHDGLVDILQVGQSEAEGWAYCVMELADEAADASGQVRKWESEQTKSNEPLLPPAHFPTSSPAPLYSPRTLASDLRQRVRLPAAECVQLGLALADALAHLHRHGLLHRDVKPANIVFVSGVPKLADIGLVAAVKEAGSFVGTRGFMPPEGHQDSRGDVFSLGKVLYECAWGRDRLDFPEVPTDAADWADHPQLVELNEVILKASDPHPALRYASAAEMQADLLLLQQGRSLRRQRRLEGRLRRWTRAGLAAGVVAAVAVGGFFYQRSQSRQLRRAVEESRTHLARLHVSNGVRLQEDGDDAGGLVHFVAALQNAGGTSEGEVNHRHRIAAARAHGPRLLVLGHHDGPVEYGDFSPDGSLILTVSRDYTARVWNTDDGSPVTPPLRHDGPVQMGVFTPDGARVATCGEDNTARVWDARTGQPIGEPMRHEEFVELIALSADGRWLATTSRDRRARVWDTGTGQPRTPWLRHERSVKTAVFNAAGSRLLTCSSDGTARLWDAESGRELLTLPHAQELRCAIFSPGEDWIVTGGDDGTVRFWNATNGQSAGTPLIHGEIVRCLEFSPDGRHLAAACGYFGTSGEVRVWDWRAGQPARKGFQAGARVYHAGFSRDGRWLVASGAGGASYLWRLDDDSERGFLLQHNRPVSHSVCDPEGARLLTTSLDGSWRVWSLRTATPRSLPVPGGAKSMQWASDGSTLRVVDGEERLRSYNSATGEEGAPAWPLNTPDPPRIAAPTSRDLIFRSTPTGAHAAVLRVWDAASRALLVERTQAVGFAMTVRRGRAESDYVATFDIQWNRLRQPSPAFTNFAVVVWNARTGRDLFAPLAHPTFVSDAAFSPNGRWLTTASGDWHQSDPGEVRLYDLSEGRLARAPWRLPHAVGSVVFSPDSRKLALGCGDLLQSARTAHLLDPRTGEFFGVPMPHRESAHVRAFSPDSRRLLTTSMYNARVWDAQTGLPISREMLTGRQGGGSAGFSPDGRRVFTATLDGTVRWWDAGTGEPITPAWQVGAELWVASGSADGHSLAMHDRRGGVHLLRLEPAALPAEDLQALAEVTAGRRLDRHGDMEAIPADELRARWEALRAKHPAEFRAGPLASLAGP